MGLRAATISGPSQSWNRNKVYSLDLVPPMILKIVFSIDIFVLSVIFYRYALCTGFAGLLVVRPIIGTCVSSTTAMTAIPINYFLYMLHSQQEDSRHQLPVYAPSHYARMPKLTQRLDFQP